MRRVVLGAIGHVDHGKSALVQALTGMATDRLAEEQRRGISIALGFAHFRVGEADIDIIDMPGHERFVRTMVSGATGIDAVLLVVAADEGIKPQTVEHVDIAGLLGLRQAVIAISKADLAPPERVTEVAGQAAALAAAAGLVAGAPVATSARSGAGLADLKLAMAAAARPLSAADDGFAHLPIDRVFSLAGHGTIVTGTLRHGALAVGDTLDLLPGGVQVRVRGLQVHWTAVQRAAPGQRVAVNLRGVEHSEVHRGMALATAASLAPANFLSVGLRAVAGGPVLRTNGRWRLLFGTSETEARLRLLDRDELLPGESCVAQLQPMDPVFLPARSRFILRAISPPATVAGGLLLDPAARRLRRGDAGVVQALARLAGATPAEIALHAVAEAGIAGTTLAGLGRLAGLGPVRVAELLQGEKIHIGRHGLVVRRDALDRVTADLSRVLAPQQDGFSRAALGKLCPGVGAAVLDEAVERLVAGGTVRQRGGLISLVRADLDRRRAEDGARVAGRLAEMVRRAALTPPDLASLLAAEPAGRAVIERLTRDGIFVRAVDRVHKRDVLFHRDAIDTARRILTPGLAQGGGLLVSEAGALLGISRKFSVPLLEYLDSVRFTRRVADRRVLAATKQ